ncbi:MAG: class I SAM-dependent methyltransferase [Promethearchaeota archaeon]
MTIDYKSAITKLMETLPFINSVIVIGKMADIQYSTDNWDIISDLGNILSSWASMKPQPITVSGTEYILRVYTNDKLVATSITGKGHILGIKDSEKIIIAQIEYDGIIPFAFLEMTNLLSSFRMNKSYEGKERVLRADNERSKFANINLNEKKSESIDTGLPFTARLMAYYRAQELKRDNRLIVDPFAERLAGDLELFINKHIRLSEMDYPIVRSHYIEEILLKPWCHDLKNSQIVILGAGLDTRAYRFKPLKRNFHTIFEIDLPSVIDYKKEILRDERPLCRLVQIPTDLSKSNWTSQLVKNGFSTDIPSFWVLEGLAYYIEQEKVGLILEKGAEMSGFNSQLFMDIMYKSRWIAFPYTKNGIANDPFSKHVKWGLDIKSVPNFMKSFGWDVTCSFADDFDEGRNVGQKGMIFIHGVRINQE